jgi:hypothetical protein
MLDPEEINGFGDQEDSLRFSAIRAPHPSPQDQQVYVPSVKSPATWSKHIQAEYQRLISQDSCVFDEDVSPSVELALLCSRPNPSGMDEFMYGAVQLETKSMLCKTMSQLDAGDTIAASSTAMKEGAPTTRAPELEVEPMEVTGFSRPVMVGKQTPLVYKRRLALLLQGYRDCFAQDLGDLREAAYFPPHVITLKPGSEPVACPVRRKPEAERRVIDMMVKGQLDSGILRTSTSPWRSEVMVVPKELEAGTDPATLAPEHKLRTVPDW